MKRIGRSARSRHPPRARAARTRRRDTAGRFPRARSRRCPVAPALVSLRGPVPTPALPQDPVRSPR